VQHTRVDDGYRVAEPILAAQQSKRYPVANKYFFREIIMIGMLLRLFIVVISLGISNVSFAYTTVFNQNYFSALWVNPSTTIDFTSLIDGSTSLNASFSPYVVSYTHGAGFSYYTVRADGWAKGIQIGSTNLNCSCAWTATNWDGRTISPTVYSKIYIDFGREELPFTINSGNSFVGFLPSGNSDGYVVLNTGVSSLSFGFSPSAVSEPESFWMLLIGVTINAILVLTGKKKTLS
jgi:hypothetical protein